MLKFYYIDKFWFTDIILLHSGQEYTCFICLEYYGQLCEFIE
jgi:hypothetical protein